MKFGFEAAQGRADSGSVEIDLEEMLKNLTPAPKEERTAFGLFIDEMQDIFAELPGLQHQAGLREWPFYIIGAGLSNLSAVLSEARSYGQQLFDYRRIGPLDGSSTRQALDVPSVRFGAKFKPQPPENFRWHPVAIPISSKSMGRLIGI
ncbi:hypothetical protein AAHB37_00925 [Glutamicibacter halophytocola]|uniref:hypothetical protein n=1 Tax=Glutamicibacter halophytocola TaxID=1933880 RepID=UPI0032193CC6